jgi:hypothetical protein
VSTTAQFQNMLNQYLPNKLLKEEFIKRDWILSNVEMDNSWVGGELIVPFKGAQASSVSFGSLTDSSSIGQDKYIRGSISTYKEVWGSLYFDHKDLMEHNKVSESNLLKMLPDQVEEFMDYMKMVVSLSMLNGASFATATANGDSSGNLTVDRPERLVINQKVIIDDNDSSPATGYVNTINMETGVVNFVTARGGAVALDLSGYTVAQSAKLYFDGSQSNGFTALRDSLLSSANSGSTSLYGVTKTAYPFTQAINVSGSTVSGTSILGPLFNGYTTIKNRGKGMPDNLLMSYKNLGTVMKELEANKGAYHITDGTKVNAYGWTEINIVGVKGSVKIVGIQEMNDDTIIYLDKRAVKIYSNGGFRKRQSPDGIEFFEVRATSGYAYIVDVCFFGDIVLERPSTCGIMYGISY